MHMKTNGLRTGRDRKRKFAWVLLPVVFIAMAVVSTVLFANLRTLPKGVSVTGWDAGGLTYSQFERTLAVRIAQLGEMQIVLQPAVSGSSESSGISGFSPVSGIFSMKQLGIATNTDAVTVQLNLLRYGSVWNRAKARWKVRGKTLRLVFNFHDETLKKTIDQHWLGMLSSPPKNAQRLIGADDRIQYQPEQPAYRVNYALLEQQLYEQVSVAFGQLEAIANPRLMKPQIITPQSADQQQKMLQQLNPQQMKSRLIIPDPMKLPIKVTMPGITVAKLKAQGIERKIGQFSTVIASGTEGRLYNIRSAANVVHDMLLAPDEVFDYAKVIQQAKRQDGFKKAPVILNGHLVPGIGGGICQVSTTLYNAALRSGLEIVQRQNHSLPIRYAPKGQDATFAEGLINFKFRNTTSAYLLLRTETSAHRMTVKLFGAMPTNVSYSVESRVLQVVRPPVKYVRNATLRNGSHLTIQQGIPGYIVETYRYKKLDGNIVSKEKISRDIYKPQPLIIARNSGSAANKRSSSQLTEPGSPGKLIIEDGVDGPTF